MVPLDLHKISEHLKTLGLATEIQKETGQLFGTVKIEDKEIPLFFRIYDGEELLQVLAFIPCNTKGETLNDTARLLHLLNKEIDIPGFGMDETTDTVFYRTLIPVKDKKIETKILDAYVNAVQLASVSFAPVIAAVAFGALTFEDVLKKSKEQKAKAPHKHH